MDRLRIEPGPPIWNPFKYYTKLHFLLTQNTICGHYMYYHVKAVWVSACNETKLMHYLSSVYSVTIPLYVSGFLVDHHQEVTMYICDNWYVLYWKQDCLKLHVIIKCETCSCYLNLLKGIGKLSMFIHCIMTCTYYSNFKQSSFQYNTYQLLHIYIVTSWWWATSKPETCRSIVTE
jgi:hypothetical protein